MNLHRLGGLLFITVWLISWHAVAQSTSPPPKQRPDSGAVEGATFRSNFFGFTYSFPKGWAVLDQESHSRLRLAAGPLYTLLIVTAKPSSGIMGPSDAAISILAEDVSQTSIHDGANAATKLAELLTHTEPQHTMLGPPQQVTLGGRTFYRLDYAQQTFPTVQHYFCSVITVANGYALRLSVIADSEAHMQTYCGTAETLRFNK